MNNLQLEQYKTVITRILSHIFQNSAAIGFVSSNASCTCPNDCFLAHINKGADWSTFCYLCWNQNKWSASSWSTSHSDLRRLSKQSCWIPHRGGERLHQGLQRNGNKCGPPDSNGKTVIPVAGGGQSNVKRRNESEKAWVWELRYEARDGRQSKSMERLKTKKRRLTALNC